jgi:hypothetical protein
MSNQQARFEARDLPTMSPFRVDTTVEVTTEERTARSGAPYKLDVIAIRPLQSTVDEPFMVEVFQSLGRQIRILQKMNPKALLVATFGAENSAGFRDVIVSLRKDEAVA